MFNHVALYRYLLPNMYLSMTKIEIQTFLAVVFGLELVSTSPAFMRSSVSHAAGLHGRLAKKTVNRAPMAGDRKGRHNLHNGLLDRCDISNACRLVVWSLKTVSSFSFTETGPHK